MLAQIRAFTKSPIATALLGLLVVSFAVFGITDVFNNRISKDAVVEAGGRKVNGAEFKQMFDNYRKQLEQQNGGQPITTEQAAAQGVDRSLVNSLATSESLAALMAKMGIVPSDAQVVAEIGKTRAFFDPISGRFDRATYQNQLQQAGLTEPQYERLLRDQIANGQLLSGLAAGLSVPRAYLAPIAIFNGESRDFSWFKIAPQTVGPPIRPTDAQLNQYIKENAARFTKPELRQLSFVQFSTVEQSRGMTVNEDDVKKRFDFEKDTLSIPETRTFFQVPVKDAATAAQVAERLRKGEYPDAVARSIKADSVNYADAPKTAVSDRKIAEAVYKPEVKAGDVLGPVQGSLGMAVVKVTKVDAGHQATLEEARGKIENELKRDAATDKVYKMVQAYDDARSGGANMAEAAKKAGVEVRPYPVQVTAQGTTLQGQPSNIPQKLLQPAFALSESGESEVIDLGNGEYAALRVDKVTPSALAALDEVRPAVTQMYVLTDLQKKLQAKADAVTAALKKGQTMAQAAASVGAKVETAKAIKRDISTQTWSGDLLNRVFQAKPGEVVVGDDVQLGLVVAKMDKVASAPVDQLALTVEQQRDNFRNVLFEDITEAARAAARAEIKPKLDYNRARTAIGLEALSDNAAPPAAGGATSTPAPGPAPGGAAQ